YGNAVEAVTGGDGLPQGVVLERPAKHVVGGGQAGEGAADGHGEDRVARYARAAVLGRARREANGAELVTPARLEEEDMHEHGHDDGEHEREVEFRWRDGRREAGPAEECTYPVGNAADDQRPTDARWPLLEAPGAR